MSTAEQESPGWRGIGEGDKLKEIGTTHWNIQNAGATNSSGFTGLPGGYRSANGHYGSKNYGSKNYGFSVRCLRD